MTAMHRTGRTRAMRSLGPSAGRSGGGCAPGSGRGIMLHGGPQMDAGPLDREWI